MAIKKKTKSDKSDKPKSDKPKRKNKPRQPWKAKQLMRLERVVKALTKLTKVITAAKAPAVSVDGPEIALGRITTTMLEVTKLSDDWAPARGSSPGTNKKAGIGSIVSVRDDLEGDDLKTYKHIPANLFTRSEVVEDDSRYWLVKCADGATRALKKKHAVLAGTIDDDDSPDDEDSEDDEDEDADEES